MTHRQFRKFAALSAALAGVRLFGQAQISKENIVAADVIEHEPGIGAADGQNSSFTLSYGPVGPASVKVFLNGLHQRQGSDYTLSGKIINFSAPPPAGSTIDVDYRGYFG